MNTYDEMAHGARSGHPPETTRRRWRGQTRPRGHLARDLERAQSTRLALARLLYGQQPR